METKKRQAIEKAIATAATMNELRTVVRHMLCMDLEKLDSVNGAALRKEGRAALAKAEEGFTLRDIQDTF